MNEDRIYGTAKNLGGKAEEGFGRVTGDVKSQVQGAAKQAEGAMQDVYGQAKDAATSAAEAIRETASEAGDFVRDTIAKHEGRKDARQDVGTMRCAERGVWPQKIYRRRLRVDRQ
jgi:uncharacterized protein YjbJ (UPF0337 family)